MKQITIYDLLPLLKKGWVAMDKDGSWGWYRTRPYQVGGSFWVNHGDRDSSMFFCFKIKRFKGGWRDSLIKVEHKCSSKCTSSGQVKEYIIHAEDFSPEPTGFMSESQLKRMFEHKEEE